MGSRIAAVLIGIICGIGQFSLMQYTLKPIAEGKSPQIMKLMFLKVPIPAALLFGCAFINANLLPYAGSAFCLSMVIAGVVNHLATLKRRG